MRVVLLGQTGPYSTWAFRHFVRGGPGYEVVGIVEGRRSPIARRVHHWVEPSSTASAKPKLPQSNSLRELAEAMALPLFQTADINSLQAYREISKLRPELFVCVGFDRLFSPALLAIAGVGGINAHPSRLPRLRGPAPIFWLLREGATEIPMTVHWLNAGEDRGRILARGIAGFEPLSSGDRIYQRSGEEAGRLIVELLPRLAQGFVPGEEQAGDAGPRARRPTPEDARVSDVGRWTCRRLAGFVIGASYFQNVSVEVGSECFAVDEVVAVQPGRRLPGASLAKGGSIWVRCSDGVVELTKR